MRLYKYFSLDGDIKRQRLLNVLVEAKFYACSPLNFNDPFDCRMPGAITYGELRRQVAALKLNLQKAKENPNALREVDSLELANHSDDEIVEDPNIAKVMQESVLDQTQRRARVVCFCGDEIKGTAEEVLVWSHYGDSHRGVCLEMTLKELESGFHKVRYSETPVLIRPFSQDSTILTAALTTKSTVWKYENEYRYIADRDVSYLGFKRDSLTAVIFGSRTPKEHRREIIFAAKSQGYENLTFRETKLNDRNFLLREIKISPKRKLFKVAEKRTK